MEKIHWSQWMGVVPFIILIALLVGSYFISYNRIILNLIFVAILLSFYSLTFIFGLNIFEFGESNLSDDVELLKLEKDNAALLWAFANGVGIAFLIPGLQIISEKPLMSLIGLVLLSVGNLISDMFYYPRYALLVRKRIISKHF